jgi:phage-related protein
MSNTWVFGGTTLSNLGVITLMDDFLDLPEARAGNIEIPFKTGTVFVSPYYDETTLQMGMTISAADSDALETVLDTLKALLSPRTQQTLARTLTDTTTRTVSAIVNKRLQVTRPAPWIAKLVIEFELAQPFFRLSTLIADNTTTINSAPKAMTVTNTGTVAERDATFLLTGPLTNVVITNATAGGTLTYTGAIAGGASVTIGTLNGEYYATHSASGNVIGNVTHSGSSALMIFNVGANILSIASSVTTTGTVKISFYPPFL